MTVAGIVWHFLADLYRKMLATLAIQKASRRIIDVPIVTIFYVSLNIYVLQDSVVDAKLSVSSAVQSHDRSHGNDANHSSNQQHSAPFDTGPT